MASRLESIRAGIIAAAAASDWPALWPRVLAARARLLEGLMDVTEQEARHRPAAGDGEQAWGIHEIARHVVRYTENVLAIIEATARGEQAPKDPIGDLAPEGLSYAELCRMAVDVSERLATVRRRLPPAPNLAETVPHAYFGPLNCREWFYFLTIHDDNHDRQVRRLKEELRR